MTHAGIKFTNYDTRLHCVTMDTSKRDNTHYPMLIRLYLICENFMTIVASKDPSSTMSIYITPLLIQMKLIILGFETYKNIMTGNTLPLDPTGRKIEILTLMLLYVISRSSFSTGQVSICSAALSKNSRTMRG